jgi:sulfur carrier protein ThiS adenylyltransferase
MDSLKIPTEKEIDCVLCERHGEKVHKILKKATVAIAGLGGLGSNVALALARAGVGGLELVDFDRVELSNLNRQQYGIRHLGRYKTEALTEVLLEVNPYLRIKYYTVRVDENNVKSLFDGVSVLCEAFDVPETKAMLVNRALEILLDTIIVSASGMAGYGSSNTVITRKITDRFYLCGDGVSKVRPGEGLMAPRVMMCASHEANMIVRLLLGYKEP